MSDDDFFKLCYDEFKRSLASSDDIYRRYPFVLTAMVVVGGGLATVGNDRYWPHLFVRVDASLYGCAMIVGFVALGVAASLLAASVWPKDYREIESIGEYLKWRTDYRHELKEKGYDDQTISEAVAVQTREQMSGRLAEATSFNRSTAYKRSRLYSWCIYFLVIAGFSLGIAVIFAWILRLRGL